MRGNVRAYWWMNESEDFLLLYATLLSEVKHVPERGCNVRRRLKKFLINN